MRSEAKKFEGLMESNGPGSFGSLEYDPSGNVLLRTADVKTTDVGGTVRVYFDTRREQVMTGRRFDPMGSGLILFRPGTFYRVQSQIEISEPIPKGVMARVILHSDIADVITVTSGNLYEGFVGPVFFTVQAYRKVEVEKMTSLASLVFFDETPDNFFTSEDIQAGGKAKTSNRDKTKRNLKEGQDEAGFSNEHSDHSEG